MKNLVLALTLVLFSFGAFSQSNDIDKRLLAKYTIEELSEIKVENPEQFKYLNYCLDKAWYITSLPKEKAKKGDGRVGSISIKDINNINIYELNIEIIKDDYQFFAIEGTDKMLVIKSEDHIKKELN